MHNDNRSNSRSVHVAAMSVVALTLALSNTAAADDGTRSSSTASPSGLEEIVVTAQKRSESVNKVPMTLQAITAETLDNRNITTVADLTKIVPGFHAGDSGYGTKVYTLRGVGLNDYGVGSSPSVAVYLDEVPLGLPIMIEQAPLDVERVEVLKGPQGTLFGQSSTGGAINYIAAKPTDQFAAGGILNASDWGEFEGTAYASGPLTDTLKARLSVRSVQGGEWQYSTTRNDKQGASDVKQGRVLLDWKPNDALNVNVNVNGFRDKSDTQAPQLIEIHPVNPAIAHPDFLSHPIVTGSNRAADWDADWPMDRNDKFIQEAIRVDYAATDSITFTTLASYQDMNFDHFFEYDATETPTATSRQYGDFNSYNLEARLAGQMKQFNWIFGASYEDMDVDDNVYSGAPWYTGGQPFPDLPRLQQLNTRLLQKVENYGIFADAEFSVTSALKLYGGVRYSNSEHKGSSCNYDGGPGNEAGNIINRLQEVYAAAGVKTTPFVPVSSSTCLVLDDLEGTINPVKVQLDLKEDNYSFRGGFDYTLANDVLLYANFRRGYKEGILPIIPGFFASQSVPATQERLDAWEGGVKAPLFGRRIQLNGAAFYYDYKDKQVLGNRTDLVFGTLTRQINVPKSRIWGVEGELVASPIDGLTVSANATYLNSRITGHFVNVNSAGKTGDLYDSRLPYSPKFSGSADAEYDWPVTSSFNAFAGASVTYRSSTNATFKNDELPADKFEIDSYGLVDLRAGIHAPEGNWRLTAWVENVGNKYYWPVAYTSADAGYRYTGMPRTYGVSFLLRTN